MLRVLRRLVIALLATVGLIAVAGSLWFGVEGISARRTPGRLESAVARRLRTVAIPSAARRLQNPVPVSPDAIAQGLEHFADHCAVCHANDGSGETEMGRGLYPRVPDMRDRQTQSLSDGELFYIIENGVRLTGMPGWGDGSADSERESWKLVLFVRHLPHISAEELSQMQQLNPKSSTEWQEEEEAKKFLAGSDSAPAPAPTHKHRSVK
jgi:mono/diheme cytochrome c family protein